MPVKRPIAEEKADKFLELTIPLFHQEAQRVLKKSIQAVRKWLIERFMALATSAECQMQSNAHEALNDYTQKGFGLQSVQVRIMEPYPDCEPYGRELLPKNEETSPTIGVKAKGMLEGKTEVRVVPFPPNEGIMEVVECLSDDGIFVEGQQRKDGVKMPKLLEKNQKTAATHSTDDMVVAMETTNHPEFKVVATEVRDAVYACLNKSEQV